MGSIVMATYIIFDIHSGAIVKQEVNTLQVTTISCVVQRCPTILITTRQILTG